MFMGEYNHTVDAKGRLIVPSRFREQLGEEFVITKGLDNCLLCMIIQNGPLLKRSFAPCLLPMLPDVNFHVFF